MLNSKLSRIICKVAVVTMGKLITAFLSLCMIWWKKRVGVWVPLCAPKDLPWHGDKAIEYCTEALLYLRRTFAIRLTSLDHFIPWTSLSEHPSSSHISLLTLKADFRLCLFASLQPHTSPSYCEINFGRREFMREVRSQRWTAQSLLLQKVK